MFPDKLLLTAEPGSEGEEGGGGSAPPVVTNGSEPPAATPEPSAWYSPAETLKSSDPEAWTTFEKSVQSGGHKDWPSVVKHLVGLEKKLGSAINLPAKDAKPEDIAAIKSKLYAAGILEAPPESPDKYEINVDAIPEQMRSEDTINTVRSWAHKHGITNEAVKELIAIEQARYETTVKPALEYTNEQGQKALTEFAASLGKEPDQLLAYAGNWLAKHFSEQEITAMEQAGFANSPVAIKFAARAGLDTGEDISVIGAGDTAEGQFEEAIKFTTDPKDPDYDLWIHGSPEDPRRQALMDRYNAAFKRKFGTGGV